MTAQQLTLDYRSILNLKSEDRIVGTNLIIDAQGLRIHVQLLPIEKAYLKADAAGLVADALVVFNHDNNKTVGVVTGRNLTVTSNLYTPARYPIEIISQRGWYEYSVGDALPIPYGAKVVGLMKDGELIEGCVSSSGQSAEGLRFIKIDDRLVYWSSIALLELAPAGIK